MILVLSGCALISSGGTSRVDRKNTASAIQAQERLNGIIVTTEANEKQLDVLENQGRLLKSEKVINATEILKGNNDLIRDNAEVARGDARDIQDRSDGYIDWRKVLFWIGSIGFVVLISYLGLLPIFLKVGGKVIRCMVQGFLNILEDLTVHEVTKRKE